MIRRCALLAGCIIVAFAWLGPLRPLVHDAFFAHMTIHMLIVAVAAPLLAIGIAGGRFDPVRTSPGLFAPIPASLLELVIVWIWHTPALHHAARSHGALFAVEQTTFLAAGLLLWVSVLGGGASRGANRTGAGIVALLLTSMHMTLLGALLSLAPRTIYAGHHHGGAFGLSPLQDQQAGGAIMLAVGAIVYLAGGLMLAARALRPTAQP